MHPSAKNSGKINGIANTFKKNDNGKNRTVKYSWDYYEGFEEKKASPPLKLEGQGS